MRTQIALGVLAVMAILAESAAPANAAEAAPGAAVQREFSAKLQVCDACHGESGRNKHASIPIIAGQQEVYLLKQIHDFESGNRSVEIMKWMAESLAEEEKAPAAAYFAKRAWPAKSAAAGAAATPPPRGIAVCQACHQANFLGAAQAEGTVAPRLAGQRYEYLVESMRRFADGERKNNATMAELMAAISPTDRDAMARYLSGL